MTWRKKESKMITETMNTARANSAAPTTAGTMKAIRIHRRGGPETLVYEDAPVPTLRPGDCEDLVAAVGLWMAATWGGVIWLIASGSYFVISLFRPEIFGRQYAMMTTIGVLIVLYVGLAFLASRERRHP